MHHIQLGFLGALERLFNALHTKSQLYKPTPFFMRQKCQNFSDTFCFGPSFHIYESVFQAFISTRGDAKAEEPHTLLSCYPYHPTQSLKDP